MVRLVKVFAMKPNHLINPQDPRDSHPLLHMYNMTRVSVHTQINVSVKIRLRVRDVAQW